MKYQGDGIEARFISFAAGGAITFLVGPLLAIAVTAEWRLFLLLALIYAAVSVVVAYIWPQLGWRTGLWFYAFFPPTVVGSFFLGQGLPGWKAMAIGVVYHSWGFVGAFFGGWLGSTLRRSRLSNAPERPASVGTAPPTQ